VDHQETILSVIIVNWNTQEDLKQCLESHFKSCENLQGRVETIVIDNASSDGSVSKIQEFINKDFSIDFIKNKENLGFPKACNQGLKKSTGKYLLLLNPDSILFSETYQKTLDYIKKNKDIGLLGIHTKNPDGSLQPSVWPEPNIFKLFIEAFYLHYFLPKKIRGRLLLSGYFDYQESLAVGMILGSFLLISRDCFEKIGFLNEKIFMFGEDLDYCIRANKTGFKVFYYHETSFIHKGNQATQKLLPDWRIQRTVSTLYFVLSQYHGRLWLQVFNIEQILSFLIRVAVSKIRLFYEKMWRKSSSNLGGYTTSSPMKFLKVHWDIFHVFFKPSFKKILEKKAMFF